MAMRGAQKHYRIADIGRRHFGATARLCGLGGDMDAMIDDVVDRTPRVIEETGARLPKGFPARVFDTISAGLRKGAEEMRSGGSR